MDLITVGSTLDFSAFWSKKMRVFDEQNDSIIATYTRFSRLRNFPLAVIAPVGRESEERKQRAGVDFS